MTTLNRGGLESNQSGIETKMKLRRSTSMKRLTDQGWWKTIRALVSATSREACVKLPPKIRRGWLLWAVPWLWFVQVPERALVHRHRNVGVNRARLENLAVIERLIAYARAEGVLPFGHGRGRVQRKSNDDRALIDGKRLVA